MINSMINTYSSEKLSWQVGFSPAQATSYTCYLTYFFQLHLKAKIIILKRNIKKLP